MSFLTYFEKQETINIVFIIIALTIITFLLTKLYNFLFFFYIKFKGKSGEKRAKKILRTSGFQIIKEQFTLKGQILEDNVLKTYILKPDYLVKKNNEFYIAEVKTGKSAFIQNRYTRRQLLEYSINFNSNTVLLINADRGTISFIKFLKK
tara:strand:- start:118 stop:567 length:450 start_codon:yes stop_codon:yes gene_type:complete